MSEMHSSGYDLGWEEKWDDMKRFGPFSRHARRLIKEMTRPLHVETVLDVGCGQGSLLAELCREFPHMKPYGVDLSPVALHLASQVVPHGQFQVLDIANGHLKETFDLIICSDVLEHISDDIIALQNLRRMTGKYLLLSAPQGRMRPFEVTEVGHVRNYAPGELVAKMASCGFKMQRVLEWGFPFYSPLYRDFLQLVGGRGTTGKFGPTRKMVSQFLYWLFMLNSQNHGDEIFVLAAPESSA